MRRPMLVIALALGALPLACCSDEPPASTAPSTTSTTRTPDADQQYAEILRLVVTPTGLVRYDVLGQHRATLRTIVESMAATDLPADRATRLAFWCNAYNANVLDRALVASQRPGFENVVKVDGFFDKQTIVVAGETMTLNDLENKKIRPLGDARIHAALVCAAISCPPLRAEPFAASTLDAQFDDQSRRWVNDPTKNGVDGEQLALSEIFKWYGDDFDGEPYGSIQGFIRHYAAAGSPLADLLEGRPEATITWMTYDWTLNQATETTQ